MRILEANISGMGLARISIENGTICSVEQCGPEDADHAYCCPGFVDLQLNGFAGIDFSAPELDEHALVSVLPPLWATGVTSFCPTLITNSLERLEENFRTFERTRSAFPLFAATVPCYHLEGPYISPGPSRGAHDPRWMRQPDWGEFQRLQTAAGGNIGILTLAPELPGSLDLIRRASQAGVRVAISHTDCLPEHIHEAIAAGATLSTHLGNGCPQMIHRHLTPIWAQLASQELYSSIICDNFHLPSDLVKVIYRMKGSERCLLVTDAVHVANLPAGRYSFVGTPIDLLPTGQVVRSDGGSMAGSALSMDRAVSNFMQLADTDLACALYAASSAPAQFLGRKLVCARLTEGQLANIVCFRLDGAALLVQQVLLAGRNTF